MPSEIRKYAFIDALRGYAVLLVVVVHSAQAVKPENYNLQALAEFGARGVQLFFIASAITLCLSWHSRKATEKSPILNFFIRRLFRIAPMYWLAIAFYLALFGFEPRYWAPNGLSWYSIPLAVMFLNGYSPENINAIVPGGWSIAVEVNFYLVFPVLLTLTWNLQRSLIFILLTVGLSEIASKAFSIIFTGSFTPEQDYIVRDFIFLNFFNQAPVFAIGISAYYIISNAKISKIAEILSLGVLFGTFIVVAIYRGGAIQYLGAHVTLTVFLFATAAVCLDRFPNTIIVNKPLQNIGKISFSLYLVHFAVLFYLDKFGVKGAFQKGNLSSIGYFLVVLTVSCVIAGFFYACVEKPGVRLGSRVICSLERRKSRARYSATIARSDF